MKSIVLVTNNLSLEGVLAIKLKLVTSITRGSQLRMGSGQWEACRQVVFKEIAVSILLETNSYTEP